VEKPRIMFIDEKDNTIAFKVFVQPRSSRNMIVGSHGDALKVKLTAPPVGNAANRMCISFFSKILGVAKSYMEIQTGHTGRTKVLRVFLGEGGDGCRERMRIRELLEKMAVQ